VIQQLLAVLDGERAATTARESESAKGCALAGCTSVQTPDKPDKSNHTLHYPFHGRLY
jgi:hypothetical protein